MNFRRQVHIDASPVSVFHFHERTDALKILTPPWEKSRIIQAAPNLKPGSRAIIEAPLLLGIWKTTWIAEHTAYDPPRMFEDTQISGPFRSWRHRHIVEADGDGSLLIDDISFEVPFGLPGRLVSPLLIIPRL